MNLTTAFLFLFITIIIPGFIFQRIYFFGEFSKQFTTKENIPKLLLTALIPGLLISAIYLPIYNYFVFGEVKIEKILTLFENLSKSNVNQNPESLIYFSNYSSFLIYCIWEFILAGSISFLFSRVIVRGLKLDRRWKTLRYKNQWYYVFSGEIFEFSKFKRATKTLAKKHRRGKDVQLARADVLIKGAEGNELYTGFVIDYDLNPLDISKLDNIYLMDAIRYKKTELIDGEPNVKEPKIVEKKLIPGELFVLNMANVINVNVSYLLEPIKQRIKGQISRRLNQWIKGLTFGIFIPLSFFIFYSPEWMNWFFLSSFSWYIKAPIFSLYMNLIAALNPRYDKEGKVHFYRKRDLFISLYVFLALVVFCLVVYLLKIYE